MRYILKKKFKKSIIFVSTSLCISVLIFAFQNFTSYELTSDLQNLYKIHDKYNVLFPDGKTIKNYQTLLNQCIDENTEDDQQQACKNFDPILIFKTWYDDQITVFANCLVSKAETESDSSDCNALKPEYIIAEKKKTVDLENARIAAEEQLRKANEITPDSLFDAYYEATGGKEKYESIISYSTLLVFDIPKQERVDEYLSDLKQDSIFKSMTLYKRSILYALDKGKGWFGVPLGSRDKAFVYEYKDLSNNGVHQLRDEMSELIVPFFNYKKRGCVANYNGLQKINNSEYDKVTLKCNHTFEIFFNRKTNLVDIYSDIVGDSTIVRTILKYDKSNNDIIYFSKFHDVVYLQKTFYNDYGASKIVETSTVQNYVANKNIKFNIDVDSKKFKRP